jgi:hypothetical protein
MNLFRSEEHVERWLRGRSPGTTIPVTVLARLADAWWSSRLAPDWRPRLPGESQVILDDLGLTAAFWRLPGT